MFFYTRYPSSSTLRTYFPDVKVPAVQAAHSVSLSLNFREFFYIQMEKFARQAVGEGVAAAEALTLRHDSELVRVLSLHYNKSSDYQIPARFLEVAEVTLREFFTAVQSGRDTDPSWKKSIYKVICKLDSEVPELFKTPGCPQDPGHDGHTDRPVR
ncbi:PROX1 protein, partial [Amia calva]|nr:PROX1 protein [Amia calva]